MVRKRCVRVKRRERIVCLALDGVGGVWGKGEGGRTKTRSRISTSVARFVTPKIESRERRVMRPRKLSTQRAIVTYTCRGLLLGWGEYPYAIVDVCL